ncbi:MAG: transcription termination/antitermination protein NusA, partial [Candidatus Omnitrophica bacterium]|nr:transcription termination/antitermination protein NusA [Candidatus Omnitrophota bacterium]
LPGDRFHVGDTVKALLIEVRRPNRGTYQLIVSRTHSDLVRRLLEAEVPEVKDGLVEIKNIARFPGDLTKVAVFSNNPKLDPVGTCLGDKGLRTKNISKELAGEKIEIIEWSPDMATYILNSLNPARGEQVILNEQEKEAIVLVTDEQLFLAIGKKGQNVRLASKLTGWNIKVLRFSEYVPGETAAAIHLLGITEQLVITLKEAGFDTIKKLAAAQPEDLRKLPGINPEEAIEIIETAKKHLNLPEGELK